MAERVRPLQADPGIPATASRYDACRIPRHLLVGIFPSALGPPHWRCLCRSRIVVIATRPDTTGTSPPPDRPVLTGRGARGAGLVHGEERPRRQNRCQPVPPRRPPSDGAGYIQRHTVDRVWP